MQIKTPIPVQIFSSVYKFAFLMKIKMWTPFLSIPVQIFSIPVQICVNLYTLEKIWTGIDRKGVHILIFIKTQIYTHLRKSERVWVSRFAFWRKWKSERLDLRFERKWKCEHLWKIWTVRFFGGFPTQVKYLQ